LNRYSCIIVEDEPLAIEKIKKMVLKVPELELLDCFENSVEALSFLKNNPVDIVFLDVRMDELSGIEFIQCAPANCSFILTTAYDEYALQGYDLNITDYLLKPYSLKRFVQAVNKAIDQIEIQRDNSHGQFLFVKTEGRHVKVDLEKVLFIEGMRDYRRIHLPDQRIMTLQTFTEFEKVIPKKWVIRVHKSYMVGINAIESIERKRIKIGDKRIPVSESYQKEFYKQINLTSSSASTSGE
tara:strand:+ start:2819 stop:3538 length:720 start_codon:yes stop_codon:yes gene_type:complete